MPTAGFPAERYANAYAFFNEPQSTQSQKRGDAFGGLRLRRVLELPSLL
ncbi:hypothetical protein [Nostoc sp.]